MCVRVCVGRGGVHVTGSYRQGRRSGSAEMNRKGQAGVFLVWTFVYICMCETSRLSTIGVLPCAAGPDALQCRQAAARREGQVRALWVVGCATCPEGSASCRPLAFFICLFSLLAPSSVLLQGLAPLRSPSLLIPPLLSSPPVQGGSPPVRGGGPAAASAGGGSGQGRGKGVNGVGVGPAGSSAGMKKMCEPWECGRGSVIWLWSFCA